MMLILMTDADILTLEGKQKGTIKLPSAFSESVRPDLILRAVNAENSYQLQPQAHFPLAGMQTTAAYFGAMHSYRSGRHMGNAIRPREKLGGGIQGKVKRIPSAVKGKRAHPHLVEKILTERINKREYQKAMSSAISATSSAASAQVKVPIILSSEFESLKKTKDVVRVLKNIGVSESAMPSKPHKRKGLRRASSRRVYKKRALIIVASKTAQTMKAASNMPGVDVCDIKSLRVNLLAPGGKPGRLTIWSEGAIKEMDAAIKQCRIKV